jgi:hypothetical protein
MELAESEGFEPPKPFGSPDFESGHPSLQGPSTPAADRAQLLCCSDCGKTTPAGLTPDRKVGGRHVSANQRGRGMTCGRWQVAR